MVCLFDTNKTFILIVDSPNCEFPFNAQVFVGFDVAHDNLLICLLGNKSSKHLTHNLHLH